MDFSSENTQAPHNLNDRFFKNAFGRTEVASSVFKDFLPPDLANSINWDTLEPVPATFIDETLDDRFGPDIL